MCERERSPEPSWLLGWGKSLCWPSLQVGSERRGGGRVENAFPLIHHVRELIDRASLKSLSRGASTFHVLLIIVEVSEMLLLFGNLCSPKRKTLGAKNKKRARQLQAERPTDRPKGEEERKKRLSRSSRALAKRSRDQPPTTTTTTTTHRNNTPPS